MTAQHINDQWREKLIKHVVLILWDGKPRTNTEIAEELQRRFPLEFFDIDTDVLAQGVYANVTHDSAKIMTNNNGKYSITEANKEKKRNENPKGVVEKDGVS
jgi:hypothetical protein